MAADSKAAHRYQPRYCTFLCKHVWAIVMRQPDGTWRIVNCLDKDEGCFSLDCALTADQGEWPYKRSPAEPPQD